MAVEGIAPTCTGCRRCFDSCPTDVIRMDKATGKAIIKYPEECVLCGWCIVTCPVDAIEFTPQTAMRFFPSWG